jgi:hypothetical protein
LIGLTQSPICDGDLTSLRPKGADEGDQSTPVIPPPFLSTDVEANGCDDPRKSTINPGNNYEGDEDNIRTV